jgi:hypothetical protein
MVTIFPLLGFVAGILAAESKDNVIDIPFKREC